MGHSAESYSLAIVLLIVFQHANVLVMTVISVTKCIMAYSVKAKVRIQKYINVLSFAIYGCTSIEYMFCVVLLGGISLKSTLL